MTRMTGSDCAVMYNLINIHIFVWHDLLLLLVLLFCEEKSQIV